MIILTHCPTTLLLQLLGFQIIFAPPPCSRTVAKRFSRFLPWYFCTTYTLRLVRFKYTGRHLTSITQRRRRKTTRAVTLACACKYIHRLHTSPRALASRLCSTTGKLPYGSVWKSYLWFFFGRSLLDGAQMREGGSGSQRPKRREFNSYLGVQGITCTKCHSRATVCVCVHLPLTSLSPSSDPFLSYASK